MTFKWCSVRMNDERVGIGNIHEERENKMTKIYFVRHAEPVHAHEDDRTRPLTQEGLEDRKVVKYALEKSEKENVPVLIMDYIITHYTEKITYQLLADKFFTSPSTVAVIIKNFKGKTLKEYITELRMEDAEHMLKNGQISLYKIAEFCGYKEYSAFYKAYKKYFGVVPKANKPKKKRWPLSKQ